MPQYYARQWSEKGLIKPLLAGEVYVESEVAAIIHKKPQNEAMAQGLLAKVLDNIAR